MKNKYKILLAIVIVLIICVSVLLLFHFKTSKKDNNEPIKVLDVIDNSPYELKENDSELKKKLFYELENILKEKDIDYKNYAEVLAKIFVVDTFSLKTKLNKYDIGGIGFILDSEQEKYKNILSDTLYDIVENNYDGKRRQELPLVETIDVNDCTESKFMFDNEELLSYDIILEWTYEKDLGYDTSALIKVAKVDDLMYIVSYSPND